MRKMSFSHVPHDPVHGTRRLKRNAVVLCVDDEPVGLSVREMTLESQGYCVLTAENGSQGLAIFSAEPVDLVILDLQDAGNEWRCRGRKNETAEALCSDPNAVGIC